MTPSLCLRTPCRSLALVFILAEAAVAAPDPGISRTPDGQAVLHRRVPATETGPGDGSSAEHPPVFVYDPVGGGELPAELHRDGQTLPRPDAATESAGAVYSPDGVQAPEPLGMGVSAPTTDPGTEGPVDPTAPHPEDPTASEPAPPGAATTFVDPRSGLGDFAQPDRSTEKEDSIHYRTVFDPSIVPFKRNRALNRVNGDQSITLAPGRIERVEPIGNRLDPGREVFWGSIIVDAAPGERIPLPSVSPASRILSYESVPKTALVFHKDGADNFYVTPRHSAGPIRVVFVMDAPSAYFGRTLPTGLTVLDVPRAMRPRPPAAIAREALAVATAIGVHRGMPYDRLVNRLVGYFRAFVPGDPPPPRGSIYEDLALGQVGICRHRGYAFVVTARALGIPARYVFNEAHVFAEVYIPGREAGWLRVDLGGGADRLTVHGGADKTLHRPRARDPFERPEGYAEQIAAGETAGATKVEGLPARGHAPTREDAATLDPDALPEAVRELVGRTVPALPAAGGKTATRTSMVISEGIVYRGEPLAVTGQVTTVGAERVPHGSVRLVLVREGRRVALLAAATVGATGHYRATVRIPEGQPPGDYELVAEFTGTAQHAPSRSP